MFSGLSAFPLTPCKAGYVDEVSFEKLIVRLVDAEVDSIGLMGSTGCYAYFTPQQRERIIQQAKSLAGTIPVIAGVGAISTQEVLQRVEQAQQLGVDALLLAPVSYHSLTHEEVFGLFETVNRNSSIPICVYDNPGTTHFHFTPELYAELASLSQIRSIKIPGTSTQLADAKREISGLRQQLPADVALGISGDAYAKNGLLSGCAVWYSVCAGVFPAVAKRLAQAALSGESERAEAINRQLSPLWQLFTQYRGSLRVIAAAASIMGLAERDCLPRPIQPLPDSARNEVAKLLNELALS
ncbi:dihydrodipicolinate synthase family protein [Rosenbergiella epipactidis]|uniref:dihydrodipicolinate synthase family protein n=1 Tax=Rosenbergiella epipactidis TaxID=1544694 RepID=UPI002025C985|nr:dihydrodipicolinate synthase family protein [Rosenbergiella epipactidis]MCL9668255.1 dihydrodipicolinate synthase family protein [Rosenbergiella epipactidis]